MQSSGEAGRRGDQIKSNYFYTFFRTGILVIQNMNCIWFSRTHFQFQWFIIFVGNWLNWAKWINELLIIKCRKPGPSVSAAIWSPFQWREGEGRQGGSIVVRWKKHCGVFITMISAHRDLGPLHFSCWFMWIRLKWFYILCFACLDQVKWRFNEHIQWNYQRFIINY